MFVESNNEEENTNGGTSGDDNGDTNKDTSGNVAEGISDVSTPPVASTTTQGMWLQLYCFITW